MIPLVAIVGATGTGKTSLSIELALELQARGHSCEIINADSMQLYRGMDIGTAKLEVENRHGIPHHLIDVLDVTEDSTVAGYQAMARTAISEIRSRGSIPIMVGGSGLYISSVIYDFKFPKTDPEIRARLEDELERNGALALHEQLTKLDPEAARAIGKSNGRRLARALEVIELSGGTFGSGIPATANPRDNLIQFGIQVNRAELVERLNERVNQMWESGLVAEVETLIPLGLEQGKTARKAIGYEQALKQISGELTEFEAIETARALTRRFARRQVSWFRRYDSILWLEGQNLVAQALAVTLSHV